MKVVLVAGGLGSRLSEETQSRPKPMVEIGGHPILWHIMKMYWRGFREFIICPDYRGYFIKDLRCIAHPLADAEPFCMTYGDGVSDVDIRPISHFTRGTVLIRRGAAAGSLRGNRPRWPPRLPQWRIFRAAQADLGTHRGRSNTLGTRADGRARYGQLAAFVHRFLAGHGYLARQDHLEDSGRTGSAPWTTVNEDMEMKTWQ